MSLLEFDVNVQPLGVGKSLIFLCVTAAAFFSLWGWGWLTRRCTRSPALSAPLTAAIGLGAAIFLGGLLNVTRIAFSLTLDLLVLLGLLFAALGWLKGSRRLPQLTVGRMVAGVPLLLVAWFSVRHLTPLAAFNYHDDLERYFAYPVKMLATGTLAPNPLGYLGADTLGAAAFLQAFVAAHLPIEYLGSVDLAGGLLLCLALAGFGLPPSRWAVTATAAECLFVAVNPQLVNISSVFSGAALIMAVVMLPGDSSTDGGKSSVTTALTGMLYAGMIALKTTFAVFVGVHLLVSALAGFAPFRSRLRCTLLAGGWTVVWLAPWIALHAPLYLAAFKADSSLPPIAKVAEALNLFSLAPLPYGSTPIHFTGLAMLGLLTAVWCRTACALNPELRTPSAASVITAGLSAGLAYLVFMVVLGPLMYGRETAIRYAIPILLGTLPAALRMLDFIEATPRWLAALPASGGLVMALFFAPSLAQRVKEMAVFRVPWAYFFAYSAGGQAEFLAYNENALHGTARAQLARIQDMVPPDETIAVWISMPFWLDFSRNTIWHADPYGVAMPWAHWPVEARYFLVEYNGQAVRTGEDYEAMKTAPGASDRIVGFRAESFLQELVNHSPRENILYRDDSYALVKLASP